MPPKCTICRSRQRSEIERSLIDPGQTFRNIAERFQVSVTALHRHKEKHLPAKLLRAQELRQQAEAGDLFAALTELQAEAREVLEAMRGKNYDLVLKAIGRLEKLLELQAKLMGELKTEATVTVLLSSEAAQLVAVLMRALEPYPEARFAVAPVLQEWDRGPRN